MMKIEEHFEAGTTSERLVRFLRDSKAALIGEGVQRQELRLLQAGGAKFVRVLDDQTALAEKLRTELSRLDNLGAGYGRQIRQLEKTKAEILAIRTEAEKIRRMSVAPGSTQFDAQFVRQVWEERILPLRARELQRQVREARVQGLLVESRSAIGGDCNGMLGEATRLAVQFLSDNATDPASRLGGLWRWMTLDGERPSLWLYHHDPDHKWCCLFFRIELTRAGRNDLYFLLESYVPFGLEGDPGEYAVVESRAFAPPSWRQVDVFGDSYNRVNTYSLTSLVSETAGQSFGLPMATRENSRRSAIYGTSTTSSATVSEGFSDAFSWFQKRSASFSSASDESDPVTTNDGVAVSIGNGFAMTEGRTLKVEHLNAGIDYRQKGEIHLDRWRSANPDTAVIYDEVLVLFDSMCRAVTRKVQRIGVETGAEDGRSVLSRLAELRNMILVEPLASGELPGETPRRPKEVD